LDVVISKVAATNVDEAVRMAADLPPNSLSQAAGLIATGLVKQSPQKALEWAQALPEGASRDAVFAGVAKEWAAKDVEGVAAWLDKLPQGSARSSAVLAFAGRSALSDPEGAALWLTTIPSSDSRSKLLTTTMQHWQRVNPKGAYEWFQGAQNLSAQERAALAAFIKPVPVKPAVVAPKAVPVIR
jgi:cytochrome c553